MKRMYMLLWFCMLFFTGCRNDRNVLWSINRISDLYTVSFFEEHRRLVLYCDRSTACYNLQTGVLEWEYSGRNECLPYAQQKNVSYLNYHSPQHPDGIYACDILTGKSTLLLPIYTDVTHSVIQNDVLYSVTSGMPKDRQNLINGQKTLTRYNLQTKDFRILHQLSGQLFNPMHIAGDFLILPVETAEQRLLYCIDTHNGEVRWQRKVPVQFPVYSANYFVSRREKDHHSLFFAAGTVKDGYALIETDIQTGEEINSIKIPSDYLHGFHIESDGTYIMLHGRYTALYDMERKTIQKLDVPNGAVAVSVHKGSVFYTAHDAFFRYECATGRKEAVFKLKGQTVYQSFFSDHYILLVLARNLKEDIADGHALTYVLLKGK